MEASQDRSIFTEDLSRHYGRLRAVQHVDLAVRSGEIFGFLGPNGSGKSTLIKVLTTILAPTSGRAVVAGHDVAREGDKVRRVIGVALQEVGLDPLMTAREMLVLQARLSGVRAADAKKRAEHLLRAVGLAGDEPRRLVKEYSGGMRRRLDLALALVNRPGILFLDEPTSGLDPASRAAVWEEVRRLNREQGMTIFLTTQYLEEADRLAHRVAIIHQGSIVAEGSPLDLKSEMGNEVVSLSFATPELAARAADVLAGVVDFLIAFVVLLGMMVFYHVTPTANLWSIPLFLLLTLITALGVGLWLSALNVLYRDINYVLPFLTQFWMYISPIAYPTSMVPEKWRLVYALNPMTGVVEGFRWALLGTGQAPGMITLISSLMAIFLFVSGMFYFRRMERLFADIYLQSGKQNPRILLQQDQFPA